MTEKGQGRKLTKGEIAIARSIYHDAIDLSGVEIRRRKWFPFQPVKTTMAPTGHIHFHPDSDKWREDYSQEGIGFHGLLLHELCHVWQTQRGIYLPLKRHPFCSYSYALKPGQPLTKYGLEQQAEIVRHAYFLRNGVVVEGAPPVLAYETLIAIFR